MNIIQDVQAWINKNDNVFGVGNLPPINFPVGFDFIPYLPTFEPQSFNGLDSNECSQLSAVNCLNTFLNWLMKTGQMTAKSVTFFQQYLDTNNSIAASEDFTGIMDGTSINGNIAQNAWKCFQKHGILPRSQLNWSDAQAAQYPDQASMDLAYYSPTRITQQMLNLAQESLKYINVSWGWIANGNTPISQSVLSQGLQTSPLQYVIPIPNPVSLYNQVNVPFTGGTQLQHCVMGYAIDNTLNQTTFPFTCRDQYAPYDKNLAINYDIPITIAFFVTMLQ